MAQFLQRNGNVRRPDEKRREKLGRMGYKKGWEVRFVTANRSELREVRRLLAEVGLKVARPYKKGTQWVQPVYGKQALDLFVD